MFRIGVSYKPYCVYWVEGLCRLGQPVQPIIPFPVLNLLQQLGTVLIFKMGIPTLERCQYCQLTQ